MNLTLKTANQSFHLTLWPMMMHYHSKFNYKRFSSWEDMVQMKITWTVGLLLWPWPWAQHSNAIYSEDNTAYDDWLQKEHRHGGTDTDTLEHKTRKRLGKNHVRLETVAQHCMRTLDGTHTWAQSRWRNSWKQTLWWWRLVQHLHSFM